MSGSRSIHGGRYANDATYVGQWCYIWSATVLGWEFLFFSQLLPVIFYLLSHTKYIFLSVFSPTV